MAAQNDIIKHFEKLSQGDATSPYDAAKKLQQVEAPSTVHRYVSTYCQHEQCSDCRLTCKLCQAPCLCPCHR